jgi:hypothetical protein
LDRGWAGFPGVWTVAFAQDCGVPGGIFCSPRTHNTGAMDAGDNKPAELLPEGAMNLRPQDLCDAERHFTEKYGPKFIYDNELDVFRFPEDGRFAFCEEFADWERLREREYLLF